jgi:hypothetical protein
METAEGTNGTGREESAEQPPKQLSEVDRLRCENLQLKLMNLVLQKKEQLRALENIDTQIGQVQVAYIAQQREMQEKYNVDFSVSEIESGTGKIVPRGTTKKGALL